MMLATSGWELNRTILPSWLTCAKYAPLPSTRLPVGGTSAPPISIGPVLVPVNSTSAATASLLTTRLVCVTRMSGNALNQACMYCRASSLVRIGSGTVRSVQTNSPANRPTNASTSWPSQAAIPWSSICSMSRDIVPPSCGRAANLRRPRRVSRSADPVSGDGLVGLRHRAHELRIGGKGQVADPPDRGDPAGAGDEGRLVGRQVGKAHRAVSCRQAAVGQPLLEAATVPGVDRASQFPGRDRIRRPTPAGPP